MVTPSYQKMFCCPERRTPALDLGVVHVLSRLSCTLVRNDETDLGRRCEDSLLHMEEGDNA
jgi:hypothetical protein